MTHITSCVLYFFFNDTATTEIYTLSLHDALPILSKRSSPGAVRASWDATNRKRALGSIKRRTSHALAIDRKSTRLNSSHTVISYAVFCLKKKKKKNKTEKRRQVKKARKDTSRKRS